MASGRHLGRVHQGDTGAVRHCHAAGRVRNIGLSRVEVYQNGQTFQSIPLTETNFNLNLFDTGDRNNTSGLPALAALNEDGTVNSVWHPAAPGSVVTLFGSGVGILSPPLKTGALSPVPPAGPLSVSSAIASCSGGCDGVLYLGSAPGLSTAVAQIAVRIPANANGGVVQPDPIGIWLNLTPGYPPPPPTAVVFVGDRRRRVRREFLKSTDERLILQRKRKRPKGILAFARDRAIRRIP